MAATWTTVRRHARKSWAVLTSMRTALVLLFLLALAAVPGATFPQRDLNPEKVAKYYRDHPTAAPIVEKLSGFDVFASPWFAAIYLLLFISLLGCLSSRVPVYVRALFKGPPAAPKRLDRLPQHTQFNMAATSTAEAAERLRGELKARRWRRITAKTDSNEVALSAEKGYLREAGNLVFHLSLLTVLFGVAIGAMWGFSGGMLIVEGATVCNTVQSYDQFKPGRLVKPNALPPMCMSLKDFQASYTDKGQPVQYQADVTYADGDNAATAELNKEARIKVNDPLRFDGAGVFLLNHGYAPILRYTDKFGTVFEAPTPFLPKDNFGTGEGVVVLPDANQNPAGGDRIPGEQIAFEGIYMATVPANGPPVRSAFPERRDEGITVLAYKGDTGLNAGIPRSVYALDQRQIEKGALKPVGSMFMRPGDKWQLEDGTVVEFVGSQEWASVQVTHDPGEMVTLAGAVGMVAGLLVSLLLRRRRIFVRVRRGDDGEVTVVLAGLTRADAGSFEREFKQLHERLLERMSPDVKAVPAPRDPKAAPEEREDQKTPESATADPDAESKEPVQ